MIRDPRDVPRHTVRQRFVHWMNALSVILLALSGLALFHPFFWPLVNLFGGGTWTRILHPFIGLFMTAFFIVLFVMFWSDNLITAADREWLRHIDEMANGDDRNMPEEGKYNGGQKVLFWAFTVCIALLLVSGVCMWRAYFNLPDLLVRIAAVVHAYVAFAMIGFVMLHVYTAIWVRGTFRAMWYGSVTRPWAWQHHRAWYRQMVRR
ncbi:MAG: formate dehydrogenase subunit gamma [Ignavibacteria bacterium]